MKVFSKELLMGGKDKYEAYTLDWSGSNIVKLIGDVTDLSKTFSPEYLYSNVYVYNGDMYIATNKITNSGKVTAVTGRTGLAIFYVEDGKLYYYNFSTQTATQIGTDTTWYAVCGYTSGNYKGFGANSSGLYYLNTNSVVKVSDITNWDMIVGTGVTTTTGRYGYGITEGKLYRLTAYENGAVQIGSSTDWSSVTGGRYGSNGMSYGINLGRLYQLATGATQIGSDNTWTAVSGYSLSNYMAVGVDGGKLYILGSSTQTQVGSATNWISCSGYATTTEYALAYTDDALYGVLSDGSTRKLLDGEFVYCGGMFSSSITSSYGIAIKKK